MTRWQRFCLIIHRAWLTALILALGLTILAASTEAIKWHERQAAHKRLLAIPSPPKQPDDKYANIAELISAGDAYRNIFQLGNCTRKAEKNEFDYCGLLNETALDKPTPNWASDWEKVRYGIDFDWKLTGLLAAFSGTLLFLRLWIPWLIGHHRRPDSARNP
ncbi:MAG: hypothetical protein WC205_04045 [Opitutaceae bacterium]|jgi:hypothetical protein